MVSAQVNCRVEQALVLMYQTADESRITIDELAAAVIDGSLRFS